MSSAHLWLRGLAVLMLCGIAASAIGDGQTLVVTAEGLADPDADTYKRDKGLMIDDLRRDARRQVVEKAVGAFIESSTLVQNYVLIEDKVLSQTKGLIKRVIKESNPWRGEDGFMHMLLRAEVYIGNVRNVLKEMPRLSRIGHIKEYGNPKISVAVTARDAKRGTQETRSEIAENILKEHISQFGYRVWSEELTQRLKQEMLEISTLQNQVEATLSVSHLKAADFSIYGKAKFDTRSITLRASGIKITKYVLTSWTVKCVDNHTGEEIYFNNKVPRRRSWSSEDEALEDIGRMIGNEFSRAFFEQHLMSPTKIYELQVMGLTSYDMGVLLKKEMIGLRPVVHVDFRNFSSHGFSLYEVEFTGGSDNFAQMVNSSVVKPLNTKLEEAAFDLISVNQGVVKLSFRSSRSSDELLAKFTQRPPASLATASAQRLRQIVKDEATLERVAAINPAAVSELRSGHTGTSKGLRVVEGF